MYEYDIHQLITPDVFPEQGPVPDFPPVSQSEDTTEQWDLEGEFEQLFRRPAAPRVHRRRRRTRFVRPHWPRVLSLVITGTTAVVAATVSVLGATVSYDPLRALAFPTAHGLAGAWPLLVYGPWFVGCLSILHAAAHRRQVKVAWIAVILFSAIAMGLCIAHAPRTVTAIATVGLPPVSALASFHLFFRQLTLLHPRHAKLPRQRKH
jgi:hypothetical protein